MMVQEILVAVLFWGAILLLLVGTVRVIRKC
jgi:hypothetical protein